MKTFAVDGHFAFEYLAYGMFMYRGKVIKRMREFGTHDYTIYGIVFIDGSVTAIMNAKVRMCVVQDFLDTYRDRLTAANRDLKILFDANEMAVDAYQSQYGLSKSQLEQFQGNYLQRQAFEISFYSNTEYMTGLRELYSVYQHNLQNVLTSHGFTRPYHGFLESCFNLAGDTVV